MTNKKFLNRLLQTLRIDVRVQTGCGNEFRILKIAGRSRKTIFLDIPFSNFLENEQESILIQLVHEIGHYIAAPAGRRNRKNYGIPEKYNVERWMLEDLKADYVGRELLKYIEPKIKIESILQETLGKQADLWWQQEGKLKTQTIIDLVK